MKKLRPKMIIDLIKEMKVEDISLFDVRKKSDLCDYVIIAEGNSTTHIKAVADFLYIKLKLYNIYPKYEGKTFNSSGWSILDTGSFIIHIISKNKREFYSLDRIFENAKKIKC